LIYIDIELGLQIHSKRLSTKEAVQPKLSVKGQFSKQKNYVGMDV
jgi:hypothetical protein